MADDKSIICEPERSRISLSEVHEAGYWTYKFGVAAERFKAAVGAAGNSAAAVESGGAIMARRPAP